ncbi:MAG: hypothetical protein Ta2B_10750 [Termitinemataceae bacterium]|nr:MAG: hypothetical protein Ta2B_10750 [Termitinemataceae bacterium]
MKIQDLSVVASQQNVQEQAAVKVAKMGLDSMETQGDAMTKLLNTLPKVIDPGVANNVDLLA